MNNHDIWNKVAYSRHYDDPFYLNELEKYIDEDSLIIEYGCGYGRLLNILYENNYKNIIGYDLSEEMIKRGSKEHPHLSLKVIEHAQTLQKDNSVDCVILSTVICCIQNDFERKDIFDEIYRILKPNGVIYFTDFLITPTKYYLNKYENYSDIFEHYGVFKNDENIIIRHSTKDEIKLLTHKFTNLWYHEQDYISPTKNIISSFHAIYKK